LEKDDEILIYFRNKKYVYLVEKKIFLNRGQEPPKTDPEKSVLFLISCWPPGKDLRRIAIEAVKD
jgi:sortase (surface protein transpeptidase)